MRKTNDNETNNKTRFEIALCTWGLFFIGSYNLLVGEYVETTIFYWMGTFIMYRWQRWEYHQDNK